MLGHEIDVAGVGGTLTANGARPRRRPRRALHRAARGGLRRRDPARGALHGRRLRGDREARAAVARAAARLPGGVLVLSAAAQRRRRGGRGRRGPRGLPAPVVAQPRRAADAVPQHGAVLARTTARPTSTGTPRSSPTRWRRWWADASVAVEPGEAREPREDRQVEHHEEPDQQHRRQPAGPSPRCRGSVRCWPRCCRRAGPRQAPISATTRLPMIHANGPTAGRPPARGSRGRAPWSPAGAWAAAAGSPAARAAAATAAAGRVAAAGRAIGPGLLLSGLRFRRRLVRHGRSLSAHGHPRV